MKTAAGLELGIITPCGPLLCTCGRRATETIATEQFGVVGYCGVPGRQPMDPCACDTNSTVHDAAYCAQKRGDLVYNRTRIDPTDIERARLECDLIKEDYRRRGELDEFSDAEVEEMWSAAYWQMLHEIVGFYQERDGR